MKLFKRFKKFFTKRRFKKFYHTLVNFINKRPVTSFLGVLLLLFLFILLGNILSNRQKEQKPPIIVKSVNVYKIGVAPRITVQAKIEKSGVVKITSLAGGVVESINVREGDVINKGTNLISLASNYVGGNAPLAQAALAQTQYKNVLDTFNTQKDLIQKQKDLANKTENNSEELRNISEQSINETKNLLNLDQDIINNLDQNLTSYEASNSAGQNNALILQTKQLKSQFQAAINGLNQSIRSTEFQSSDINPPSDLARLQRDIALKQLDIQEKTLNLNKEIVRLQSVLAGINADVMHPGAPFSGKIERIYVKIGQAVTPGTPLLLISGDGKEINAIALISENIAKNVSKTEASTLYFGRTSYDEHPFFISTEATDNQLFSVQYLIPDEFSKSVFDGEYISVNIPIGYPDTARTIPYVPLDAIYQSQEQAYLLVAEKGKAVSRTVKLGQIYGGFVEIVSGLKSGDQVILNRNIIAGDSVSPGYGY
ncbi:MAG: hypothetical protein Q7K55_01130 [Candidatus Levybacteria bacterium]|nr:hypothetical protein [Candidatus Levybacteria bacterium]